MNYKIDISNTETFPRYVKVPYPCSQEVEEIHDVHLHSIFNPEDDDYILVEEDFLKKHIDEDGRVSTHEIGPSYEDLVKYDTEYRNCVEEPGDFYMEEHDKWEQGLNQYIHERSTGEVSNIQEFKDKYDLI